MIEKQVVQVPAKTDTQTVAVICDVCKTKHPHATNYGDGIDWNEGYTSSETKVAIKHTTGGPYGGYGDVREYHVCRTCFTEKLEPFLKSLDAQPSTYDFDW